MKYKFQVAIRNDQGQVLILEKKPAGGAPGAAPCFPGGDYDNDCKLTPETMDAVLIRRLQRQVLQDTGLSIGGVHLGATTSSKDGDVHGFTAFASGGNLPRFPVGDYVGASWMTPSLALTLRGLTTDMAELLRRMSWLAA